MIVCILGPTGIGKTKLSLFLAQKLDALIINNDAMQIYQGMDIGTAKLKPCNQAGIPHYLIDVCSVMQDYSVYDYQKAAREIIETHSHQNIIMVGGTGLYLRATLYDYHFPPEEEHLVNYETYSNQELYDLALAKDPHHQIHPHNRRRLIRFLERKNIVTDTPRLLYKAIFILLGTSRTHLYQIIDARVEEMIQNGLVEEVKQLYHRYPNSRALMTAIGYKELIRYFKNEIDLASAIDLIKRNSRHYAKRQITFFKHQFPVRYFEVDSSNFAITEQAVWEYIEQIQKE